jgi:serine/threonine protein kinase
MTVTRSLHPTDETLIDHVLGNLNDASAGPVGDHLETCSDCQGRLDALFSSRILGRLRKAQGRADSRGPMMSSTAGLSSVAAGHGSPAPPAANTLPPELADHPDYEVTRELGRGGMGVVYLARNRLMGRLEVLKVVGGHLVNRPGVLDRFLAEIRNAARLQHPNIVTAYSAPRVGASIALAMEYVEGLDLSRLAKAKGPLPVSHACSYVQQVALGLQHADEHGMVHRDIKPSNLMLTRQGDRALIKILDFGLAKVRSEGATIVRLTDEGQMLGTPAYIAPEQIGDARHADIRADIYSLGCTLYYLLAGSPPFEGECLYDVLQAHHSMEAMPLNLKRPEVPVELAALVAKMMAKEPERRFQQPKEVAQALIRFFKKGELAFINPETEVSRAGRSDWGREMPIAGSTPAQSVTTAAQATAEPIGLTGPSPRERARETLIDPGDAKRTHKSSYDIKLPRRTNWTRPGVAVAALSPAFFIALAVVVLRLRDSSGVVELINLPQDAVVFVDGQEVPIKWRGAIKGALISVTPGKHKLTLKRDGLEIGAARTVEAGENLAFNFVDAPLAASDPAPVPAEDGSPYSEMDDRPAYSEMDDRPADPEVDDTSPPLRAPGPVVEPAALADEPSTSQVSASTGTGGAFRPLFNGKDLGGWKQHPKQQGHWIVENGILTCPGPAPSHLYTDRDDFQDFHLRVEARFDKGGSGGVYIRCPFGPGFPRDDPKWPDAVQATINGQRIVRNCTGGIDLGDDTRLYVTEFTTVRAGQWFTMDVIANGNSAAVLVNGRSSAYHTSPKRLLSRGHLALQQASATSKIEFRKIEILELPRSDQKDPKEIWQLPMGRVTRVAFSQDGNGILSAAFPNERWLVKGGMNHFLGGPGHLRLSDQETGQIRFTMAGIGWPIAAIALSSDGLYAASCPPVISKQPVLIWDLKSGRRIHVLHLKNPRTKLTCGGLSFAQGDHRVMAFATNGTLYAWDIATDQEQPPLALAAGPAQQNEFTCSNFGFDREHLATGRRGGPVELWDLRNGKKLRTFAGHTGRVDAVTCSPDGRLILSAGSDQTVRLWDVSSERPLRQWKDLERQVRCVAFSPDAQRALAAGIDGPVRLWDLTSGEQLCRLEGHTMPVNSVAFSPDGGRAVSGSDDRTVRLWQLPAAGGAGATFPSPAGAPAR